jgi:hypothetical protein
MTHALVGPDGRRHRRRGIKPLLGSFRSRNVMGGGRLLVLVLVLVLVLMWMLVLVLVHWRQRQRWRELQRWVRCRRHGRRRVAPTLRAVGWMAAVRAVGRVRLCTRAVRLMIDAIDYRRAGQL